MDENDTRQRLTQITDPGHFEKLATAVLREEDALCRRLAHVGVNAEGKTIRSPVDAIVYTSVDGQRNMLAVHHTTCRLRDLRRKWLSDPDSDLQKTLGELRALREKTPDLGATLILTTNKDPAVKLVHEVEKAGREEGIEIRVWAGSALAHFLDFDPKGQWIRRTFLGVDPTRLSEESLSELSVLCVESAPLLDDPERWVDRDVDEKLRNRAESRVQFVLGESGVGKTVACLKCLQRHVQAGGYGLVMTDEVLGTSLTIEDAVERTLRNLQADPGRRRGERSAVADIRERAVSSRHRGHQPVGAAGAPCRNVGGLERARDDGKGSPWLAHIVPGLASNDSAGQ